MKYYISIVIFIISQNFLFSWNNADYTKYNYKTFAKLIEVNKRLDMENIDYKLLNAAIFYETCRQRVLNNRKPFKHSSALEKAAFEHSVDMVKYKFFSHTSKIPKKRTMSQRLAMVGIKNCYMAENISISFGIEYKANTSVSPAGNGVFYYGNKKIKNHTYLGLAKAFLISWMNSPEHRKNILNQNYTYLGCGAYHYKNFSFYQMDHFKGTQNFADISGK